MPSWTIGHVDSERGYSGGEVQVFLLLEGLRRAGHRPILFGRPSSRCAREAERRGLTFVPVPMANDLDWRGFAGMARAFREHHLDLVHTHTGRANWLGGIAAWRSRIPAISTRRMDRRVKNNWRNRMVYGRFLQRVVAISPAVRDCLIAGGVASDHVVLIPEAVDPKRLIAACSRSAMRAKLGATDADGVLLVVAALVRRKGIDVLLDALAALASQGVRPQLWIAGDGPEKPSLEEQMAQLGIAAQVRFLGRREDAADLYAASDIFVVPSRREGLGVAALEAMGAGRPVVCSAVGGLPFSVVDGGTGLHVPPEDPTALAAALRRLLDDVDLRYRLGAQGPARIAEEFTPERMIAAHLRLYAEVLAA
ncbi:MAG TPA: glycosyltransferase family 4 protein, partial [Terriglobales bacterium]|nr:glycosyltransferase family 4 protein [Terriglobales bacterium]